MSRRSIVLGSFCALVVLAASTTANAQSAPETAPEASPAPLPAAPPPPVAAPVALAKPVDADKPVLPPKDGDGFKSVAITANPLSLLLLRVGLNVEYLPVKHHAAVINPYFQSTSITSEGSKTSYTSYGGELGYRYYTGDRGASGGFIGPSLILQQSNANATATANGRTTEANSSIFIYGAALDFGGQHVTKSGFTIGGGLGVMYLTATDTSTATSTSFKVSGFLPRLLFTAGYSF